MKRTIMEGLIDGNEKKKTSFGIDRKRNWEACNRLITCVSFPAAPHRPLRQSMFPSSCIDTSLYFEIIFVEEGRIRYFSSDTLCTGLKILPSTVIGLELARSIIDCEFTRIEDRLPYYPTCQNNFDIKKNLILSTEEEYESLYVYGKNIVTIDSSMTLLFDSCDTLNEFLLDASANSYNAYTN